MPVRWQGGQGVSYSIHTLNTLSEQNKSCFIYIIYAHTSDVLEHKWRASLKTILFLHE